MRYCVEGWDRRQTFLLPETLGNVHKMNRARAVDAYVDELDLPELGLARAIPAETGKIRLMRRV